MSDPTNNLPLGWVQRPLGEIAYVNPRWMKDEPKDSELVSFIPMAAVEAGSGKLDPTAARPWKEVKKGYTRFQEGDVLFAKITPCMENGKVAVATRLAGGRGAGSTEFHVLRPIAEVQPKFFLHFLLREQLRRDARVVMKGAAGQLRVPPEFLESVDFPLPPAREQHRIVSEIEKQFTRLEAGGAALKRVQANLKRYCAAVLKAAVEGRLVPTEAELARLEGRSYEAASDLLKRILADRRDRWEAKTEARALLPLKAKYKEPAAPNIGQLPELPEGWAWASVDQLTCLITSGSRGWAELYSEEGPLFIRAQDIKTDRLELSSVAHVRLPQGVEGARTLISRFDILVTITGANVTKTAVVNEDLGEAYVSQHVGLVRPLVSALSGYMYYWIVCPAYGRRELVRAAYGAGKPGLNLDNLRELLIAVPPLTEQCRIVTEVERRLSVIEEVGMQIEANLKRAERLRQAILKRAFEGKLVPQDPTDEPASVLLERIRAEREARSTGNDSPKRARKVASK